MFICIKVDLNLKKKIMKNTTIYTYEYIYISI